MENKKKLYILGALAVFALLLVVSVNFFLIRFGSDDDSQNDSGENKFRVTDLNDDRPIIYTEDGFSPQEVTVSATDQLGCSISVQNRTDEPLDIGVSPHQEANHPGVDYVAIGPRETGAFDPRYPGIREVGFHSHGTPPHAFTVTYGEGCVDP